MNFYSEKKTEIIEQLGTNALTGLSTEAADTLLQSMGENKLKEKKKKSVLVKFLEQLKDAMIIILIIAAIISFTLTIVNGEYEFFEPALIIAIVILNAIMGVVQESKAEKALDALKNLSAPHARVIRDGTEQMIDAKKLVPGDLILLEAGDFVPADARLIEASSLKAEESALTGESVPSEKDATADIQDNAPLGDRKNMVYSGCSVVYGRGRAVVTATGMNTEMGKIAGLLNNEKTPPTPLQKKLGQLGKYLGIVALAACLVVFVVGLLDKIPVMEILMVAISLAVSAMPEGLPAIVTIVLSIGVTRMVKRNAIIKRLPAVESLGSASVICSDKTGTLTQNKMTLVKYYSDEASYTGDIILTDEKLLEQNKTPELLKLLEYATLCCDGAVIPDGDGFKFLGDPTETSIIFAALKNGLDKEQLNARHPRIAEVPFESDRKLMSTVNVIDGQKIVIVKGAFDVLAKRCIKGDTEKARQEVDDMAKDALRVLAVAYKTIDELPSKIDTSTIETDLTFLGLVGMIDPPREEAKDAVAVCRKAGIKPVMITGDHIVTASAIAKQLGIQLEGDDAVTGEQLAQMSEEELMSRVRNISVYARVSPEDKIRIVKAWKAQGEVVAMTGDGVNDAPALKAADIGCAMGITGTDVAKSAADMTLTDDNFATIVHAVKEGRGIYDNIKKVVGFLLGTNASEILSVFIAILIWRVSPFTSVQLLWINLATDSLPAIALGMEEVEKDVMLRKPKPQKESIFAHGYGIRILLQGIMFASLTLGAYVLGLQSQYGAAGATTMAFIVLGFTQIFHSFNMRSTKSLFKINPFGNKFLLFAFAMSSLLMCIIVFVPQIAAAFGFATMDYKMYLIAFALALVPVPVMEIAKALRLIKH
jgi:Ca2+-transporting ATPase